MKSSQYFDDCRAARLVKVNCLIREVPEHFIWVFLNLPLVYHAFLFPQLHPLPRFKKQWSMSLKWTWDFDLGYHICRRYSFYAGQGLLQNFPLEQTSAQICLDRSPGWRKNPERNNGACKSQFAWLNKSHEISFEWIPLPFWDQNNFETNSETCPWWEMEPVWVSFLD